MIFYVKNIEHGNWTLFWKVDIIILSAMFLKWVGDWTDKSIGSWFISSIVVKQVVIKLIFLMLYNILSKKYNIEL